jgi:GT2 family glycosyltransferase
MQRLRGGMASVLVCLPSRDGRFRREIVGACMKSMRAAVGIESDLTHADDRYNVATCRNKCVARFLGTSYTHLLFVDDDVSIPENTIADLAAVSEKSGGLACGMVPSIRIDPEKGTQVYVQVMVDDKWLQRWPTQNVECEITGGGCMMIPREVFAKVGFPWFRWTELYDPEIGLKSISDDSDFCMRARMAGYRITAVASVRCGHGKEIDCGMLIGD